MKTLSISAGRPTNPSAEQGPWPLFAELLPGLRWRRHLARVTPAAAPRAQGLFARHDYGYFSTRAR